MPKMGDKHDIELLMKSQTPIIALETDEELRALDLITGIGISAYRPVYQWTVTEGLQRRDIDLQEPGRHTGPDEVLKAIKTGGNDGVYLLIDFHPYLDDAVHVRLLKDIALRHEKSGQTLILVSHALSIPRELEKLSATARLALPDRKQLEQIVRDTAKEWGGKTNKPVTTDEKTFQVLINNLSGMTGKDARRLARGAIFDDGAITQSDLPQVMKSKYELLNRNGVLSYEYDTAKFSEVGGLRKIKSWLEQRKAVFFDRDNEHRLDPPKGLLLLGVQGGGKSLAAKAVAGMWGIPLLRMDFGAIYNKFHGETERNLRESLQTADAMAPCVLWIDEIEKGLASGDNDGGTSRRVLGTLLTWMAEKKSAAFIVATANDIASLPPELIRKGRFDEIFFIDLPADDVRRVIFEIHLRKRGLEPQAFDLAELALKTDGFSGAEIEQAVVSALYAAHAGDAKPQTADLIAEIEATRPLSMVMREKIAYLRSWALERAVPGD